MTKGTSVGCEWIVVAWLAAGCSSGANGSAGEAAQSGSGPAGPAAPVMEEPAVESAVDEGALAETPPEVAANPADGARGCTAPEGVSGSPRNIAEAVALMNALPKPTSIACLLESLERPLEVYLTSSGLSAQPAPDARSPRTFIIRDQLILSVVPGGDSAAVLELAFRTSPGRAIRGEIPFPLTADVTAESMVRHVQIGGFSMCGGCHTNEFRTEDAFFDGSGGAYESDVIAPFPPYQVELQTFREEALICDPASEPERCSNLSALFDHGEVTATRLWSESAP